MNRENNYPQHKEGIIKWEGKKAKVFGSFITQKRDNETRIILGNINTIPTSSNRHKLDLWHGLVANNCDVNIIVETNKDMRRVREQDRTYNLVNG